MVAAPSNISEGQLFLKIWERQPMTPTLARHVLKLNWTDGDRERIHELSVKNSICEITPNELAELDAYVSASFTLSILHLRAYRFLKLKPKRVLS